MSRAPRIGILAVQGDVREHAATLRGLGAVVVEVRRPDELAETDGVIIPGGESTAIGKLIGLSGLLEPLRAYDRPMLGTCAGMILLAREATDGIPEQPLLARMDLVVRRNGYGRQLASFEADLDLAGDEDPLHGVFIRAPRIVEAGPGVEILATLDGDPVLVQQGRILAAAFHPELTEDTRVHERFLAFVREEAYVGA
jgi:pyridoxal 5'-phosphate synthase pdxT subunit